MKAKRAKKPFFMVTSKIYDFGLSRNAQDVYIFLCKMADNEDGTSHPGKKYIAANCRIGITSVYYALKELEREGLIKIEPRYEDGHQKSNLYTVYDSLGDAHAEARNNAVCEGQTSVPPHSPDEPLPVQELNPYPFTEQHPTHSPNEHGTKTNELESSQLEGGGSPPARKEYGIEFQLVQLHQGEYDLLADTFGAAVVEDYVNRLDMHIASTGKKYASHYATIYKWITEDKRKAAARPKQPLTNSNRFANFSQREYTAADFEKIEKLNMERLACDENN